VSHTKSKTRKRLANRAATGKRRKTFSLAADTVEFLESYRRKRNQGSLTVALEAIIHEQKQQQELEQLTTGVSAYYDSLSSKERDDEKAWAEFAESQLPHAEE